MSALSNRALKNRGIAKNLRAWKDLASDFYFANRAELKALVIGQKNVFVGPPQDLGSPSPWTGTNPFPYANYEEKKITLGIMRYITGTENGSTESPTYVYVGQLAAQIRVVAGSLNELLFRLCIQVTDRRVKFRENKQDKFLRTVITNRAVCKVVYLWSRGTGDKKELCTKIEQLQPELFEETEILNAVSKKNVNRLAPFLSIYGFSTGEEPVESLYSNLQMAFAVARRQKVPFTAYGVDIPSLLKDKETAEKLASLVNTVATPWSQPARKKGERKKNTNVPARREREERPTNLPRPQQAEGVGATGSFENSRRQDYPPPEQKGLTLSLRSPKLVPASSSGIRDFGSTNPFGSGNSSSSSSSSSSNNFDPRSTSALLSGSSGPTAGQSWVQRGLTGLFLDVKDETERESRKRDRVTPKGREVSRGRSQGGEEHALSPTSGGRDNSSIRRSTPGRSEPAVADGKDDEDVEVDGEREEESSGGAKLSLPKTTKMEVGATKVLGGKQFKFSSEMDLDEALEDWLTKINFTTDGEKKWYTSGLDSSKGKVSGGYVVMRVNKNAYNVMQT